MKKSISVNEKSKRGRPRKKGGVHPVTAVRLPPELGEAVDEWAAYEVDSPNRSTAIRRLVEIGLGRAFPIKMPATAKTSAASADRAKELAEKTIERLTDPETPSEERVIRRRRLVKGPSEFREDRVDQPRPKKR